MLRGLKKLLRVVLNNAIVGGDKASDVTCVEIILGHAHASFSIDYLSVKLFRELVITAIELGDPGDRLACLLVFFLADEELWTFWHKVATNHRYHTTDACCYFEP